MSKLDTEAREQSRRGRRVRVSSGWLFHLRWLRPALAAAMLLLVFLSSFAIHRAHVREASERRQAELIQARFALAMRLTSRSLANASRAAEEAGARPRVRPAYSTD